MQQLATPFIDDKCFEPDEKRSVEKMKKILIRHAQVYEATAGIVQLDKNIYLFGNGREKMGSSK